MHDFNWYPDESSYQTIIEPEVLSDGRLIFMARHPELRGCRAQGDSPEEAKLLLAEVFRAYLEHLREYNLPIPQPNRRVVSTAIWSIPRRQGFMVASAIRPGVTYGMKIREPRIYFSRIGTHDEHLTSGTQ